MDILASSTELTSIEQDNTPTFPLLRLPAELWIRICREAVTFTDDISISKPHSITSTKADVHQPAITRICRIIRAETLHVFYTKNEFIFRDSKKELPGLPAWVEAMIATGRWKDVKSCIISSSQGCIRPHMKHLFENREAFSAYRVRLIALEGENPRLVKNGTVRRFKLQIELKEDPEGERRSVIYDDNGTDI